MTDPTPEDVECVALLPCPFCSGEARVFHHLAHWSIACRKCGVAFTQPSQEKVIAAWERRAAMPDRFALIRELRDALALIEPVWARVLADRHGGTAEEMREPILNAMRAALRKANEALI